MDSSSYLRKKVAHLNSLEFKVPVLNVHQHSLIQLFYRSLKGSLMLMLL